MHRKGMMAAASVLACVLGGAKSAAAQAEIEALVYDWPSQSLVAQSAIRELGYTLSVVSDETFFIQFLNRQSWDLVVLQLPRDDITQKAVVAQLLEDHVAAGGRLLVNFNNLDEWPRLQRLMGVSVVRSLTSYDRLVPTDPKHAVWHNASLMNVGIPSWQDSGDELMPLQNSTVVGLFETSGLPSMVMANAQTTIVNGFDWDSYFGAGSMAHDQVEYLMECRVDFDQSSGRGVLDIFDFLRFQDLFINRDPRANMCFDTSFDIFDFLAFQDAFIKGCQ